jgi:hypothetical protein
VANRAEQNGIYGFKPLQPILWHHVPMSEVIFSTPVVTLKLKLNAKFFGDSVKCCDGSRDDLRANPITWYYGDQKLLHDLAQSRTSARILHILKAGNTIATIALALALGPLAHVAQFSNFAA